MTTTYQSGSVARQNPTLLLRQNLRSIIVNLFPSPWLWLATIVVIAFDFFGFHYSHKFLLDTHKLWLIGSYPLGTVFCAWLLGRNAKVKLLLERPLHLILILAYMIPTICALGAFDYLAMATSRPMMDGLLMSWDQALGLDWFAYAEFIGSHPWLNFLLFYAYNLMMKALVLVVAITIIQRQTKRTNEILALVVMTSLICMTIGMFFPADGAMAIYGTDTLKALFPPGTGTSFLQDLYEVRGTIPKYVDPMLFNGLTAFPSFHTVSGILVVYCSRGNWWKFYPALVFSTLLIAATPIYGGHFFSDVIAGAAVAAFGIFVYRFIFDRQPAIQNFGKKSHCESGPARLNGGA